MSGPSSSSTTPFGSGDVPSQTWIPHTLPESRNIDGRPVWEPPVLDYQKLIGDEYEEKRKAILKYTNGNIARATEILDITIELDLLIMYCDWISNNMDHAWHSDDSEGKAFFHALLEEINIDQDDLWEEWHEVGIYEKRMGNGTWEVKRWPEIPAMNEDGAGEQSPGLPPPAFPSLPDESITPSSSATIKQNYEKIVLDQDTIQPTEDAGANSTFDPDAPIDPMTLWW